VIGSQVSHYLITGRLGAGGMGEVFEARDTRLGRRVALKFLPRELSRDERALGRLLREARIASSLNHPHICTIHDIDSHHGEQFIVMELLEGGSLDERIAAGPLQPAEMIDIMCQAADALDAAHRLGIIHRDIKPANIFITATGRVKVLDFGFARQITAGSEAKTTLPKRYWRGSRPTGDGLVGGTVNYLSPEQIRGRELDPRSDLFSLGVVMYEMATGRKAFTGATSPIVFNGILNKQPEKPTGVNPQIPYELEQVILNAMQKEREKRFQSASGLIAALQHVRREISGEAALGRTAEFFPRVAPARSGVSPTPARISKQAIEGVIAKLSRAWRRFRR
jgi:serine/threonine protein kinase